MSQQKKRNSSTEIYEGALAEPLPPRHRRRMRRVRKLSRPLGMNRSVSGTLPPVMPTDPCSVPQWRWEYGEKLSLLLDHYKIRRDDPSRSDKLILCLAVAHVPGFQEKARRKGGRPRAMTSEDETKLYARFCEFRQRGHSDRNAARLIATDLRKSWRSDVSDASVLRRMQRCAQTAKKFAALLQSMNGFSGLTQNSTL